MVSTLARQKGKKNMFNHVFGASSLFKRGALGQLLQALARKDFKDWTKPLGFEASGVTHNNYRLDAPVVQRGALVHVLAAGFDCPVEPGRGTDDPGQGLHSL